LTTFHPIFIPFSSYFHPIFIPFSIDFQLSRHFLSILLPSSEFTEITLRFPSLTEVMAGANVASYQRDDFWMISGAKFMGHLCHSKRLVIAISSKLIMIHHQHHQPLPSGYD
jgi:hypothetical protein